MPLTQLHKIKIIYGVVILFYALMLLKLYNGLLLFQLEPILFNTRPDLFTWIFMQTGIPNWLLGNRIVSLLFDIGFYSMPLIYLLAEKYFHKQLAWFGLTMLLMNWIYIQCHTLYPTNSIESHMAWLLFPLLFMMTNLRSFYLVLHGLRYFFLFFFTSAAVWKFVQGGLFNMEQMSGILLFQHKELLISSPGNWYTNFIYWLINKPTISYQLYLLGTLLELVFIVGFFTKKFDQFLIIAFIIFLAMDALIMRIHYWEMTPFLLTLLFSRYKMPERSFPKRRIHLGLN